MMHHRTSYCLYTCTMYCNTHIPLVARVHYWDSVSSKRYIIIILSEAIRITSACNARGYDVLAIVSLVSSASITLSMMPVHISVEQLRTACIPQYNIHVLLCSIR